MALFVPQPDRERLDTFCRDLVTIPSCSGSEGALAERIVQEMEALHYDQIRVDDMGNVIGRVGPEGAPAVLFDGHMDTVDVGDRGLWSDDPLAGVVRDGVLYGRGAADMKGGLAAMIHGVGALAGGAHELVHPVYVACVVLEEPCEGLAIRHVIEQEGLRPAYVVLGEPTDLQLSRGHRGRLAIEVAVQGRSCHASAPERGTNAIYEAARFVFGLQLLAPQLTSDALLGQATLAVTEIESRSGSANVVPEYCRLYIDRRLTGGDTEAKALAEIKRILTRESIQADVQVPTFRTQSYTGLEVEALEVFPSWTMAEDDPLVRKAIDTVESTLGYVPRVGHWDFSTDGVYTMGTAGIPTIGFGPGEERYAHSVQEQVRLGDVHAAARVYGRLALSLQV
ncbi:MAG: YgeY family selenium metabolism-linked hydrolase [Anaerolineae bacterium]|jgi:putative selenium metabolism hydrolase|nr:YgeY family selenium metabolism-linked hydrolase [Chloroflexota bacterium]